MLITVIDISEHKEGKKKFKVYAIISIEEKNYNKLVGRIKRWVKHFRELDKREKLKYLKFFPDKFSKIRELRYCSCFYLSDKDALLKLDELSTKSKILIADDKIYKVLFSRYGNIVKPERQAKREYEKLIYLADSLANYVRIKLSEDLYYRKRAEIIRRFWK